MKREIIVKTLMGKGKLSLHENMDIELPETASKTLGCWIINHNYTSKIIDKDIILEGSYDIQLWYALDNDSKTNVFYETHSFHGAFVTSFRSIEALDDEIFLKVHVTKYPTTVRMELDENHHAHIDVESEYLLDTFQDAILQIETLEQENEVEVIDEEIVMNVDPNYITNENKKDDQK